MLLALKVRPEALPTGSPMSVLENFCNVEVDMGMQGMERTVAKIITGSSWRNQRVDM